MYTSPRLVTLVYVQIRYTLRYRNVYHETDVLRYDGGMILIAILFTIKMEDDNDLSSILPRQYIYISRLTILIYRN